jgi:hypothetical protein
MLLSKTTKKIMQISPLKCGSFCASEGERMIRSKIAMGFLWAILALALHVSPRIVGPLHGQSSRKDDIVFNSRGVPLAGASIRVCAMPASGQPCTPLALIYSDAALTQALANPTTTDGLGNYFFYAAPGKYEIEISGPGISTKQIPNVVLPSDPNAPTFTGAISAFSLTLSGNLTVAGNTVIVGNLASGTLNMTNQSVAPGAAGAGTVNLYTKTTDKRLYYKDDSGTEIGPIAASSGAQTNVVNTFTAAQNFDSDFHNKGPNPWADLSRFGAYFGALTPPSTTGSITSGQAALTVANAQDFANGHGILILTAGAAPTISTPSGLTVAPWGVTGSTAYNYCVVAEDYKGGRTGCGASAASTTSAAALGINTATITNCTRTSGITVCTTSANHNFTAGAQVEILKGSTTDSRFEGAFSMVAATATTFTFNQYGYQDATISSGTARVNATNLLRWNSNSANTVLRWYIYRCTASCGVIGPNYSLAGMAQGVDGYFQDYGFTPNVAFIGNGDVSATAPTSASNQYLSTTILSGGGTTALTLANNAGSTVAGATVLHDNAPNIIAACTSFANANGQVYIPANNVTANWFHIKSNLDLRSCPGQTQIQVGNKVWLNGTVIMGFRQNIQGLPSGYFNYGFYVTRPPATVEGYGVPLFYMANGANANSFDDLYVECDVWYQSCFFHDQLTVSGGVSGIRYRNVVGANTNTPPTSTPFVIKGGFGDWFEYGGFQVNANSFAAQPALLLSVNCGLGNTAQQFPYLISTSHTFNFGAIVWDGCNQNPTLGMNVNKFDDILSETNYGPMFRIANTGASGVVAPVRLTNTEINRPVTADSVAGGGTPMLDAAMGLLQGVRIVSAYINFPIAAVSAAGQSLEISSDTVAGPVGTNMYAQPGLGYFSNMPVTSSGAFGHIGYQLAVPGPAQSAIVSGGGSVLVGPHTYTIGAMDFSGNETTASAGVTATTTSGNQTVTVTLPATFPTGAAGVSIYKDGVKVSKTPCSGTPQFTVAGGTFLDTFAGSVCSQGPPGQNTAGAALMDANGVTTAQLKLSAETLTASPRAEQTVFLPGALTATWTASSWTLDKAVTVTRLQVQAKTAPSGCTTNAIVRLTDGTTPVNVTVSAAANDSGAITQNYAAGATLTIAVQTAASGCTTTPADGNVVVQYKMQ